VLRDDALNQTFQSKFNTQKHSEVKHANTYAGSNTGLVNQTRLKTNYSIEKPNNINLTRHFNSTNY